MQLLTAENPKDFLAQALMTEQSEQVRGGVGKESAAAQ